MDQTVDEFAAAVGTVGSRHASKGRRPAGERCAGVAGGPRAGRHRADRCGRDGARVRRRDARWTTSTLRSPKSVRPCRSPAAGRSAARLASGVSDITRLAHGPMRDVLLQTHFVAASGQGDQGGRTDGEERQRVRPVSAAGRRVGHARVLRRRDRPDATTPPIESMVHDRTPIRSSCSPRCTGRSRSCGTARRPGCASTATRDDVDATAVAFRLAARSTGRRRCPARTGGRWPRASSHELRSETPGSFVAEIGVGVVHRSVPQPRDSTDAAIRQLHDRIKQQFDPSGRLNPGLDPLSVGVGR